MKALAVYCRPGTNGFTHINPVIRRKKRVRKSVEQRLRFW